MKPIFTPATLALMRPKLRRARQVLQTPRDGSLGKRRRKAGKQRDDARQAVRSLIHGHRTDA